MQFLLFAVIASAVGITIVLLRHRRPTSMESSIGEFERGLRALAPEEEMWGRGGPQSPEDGTG